MKCELTASRRARIATEHPRGPSEKRNAETVMKIRLLLLLLLSYLTPADKFKSRSPLVVTELATRGRASVNFPTDEDYRDRHSCEDQTIRDADFAALR